MASSETQNKHFKYYVSLGGALELKGNCILCWAGRWKHTAHLMFCSIEPSETQWCHTHLSFEVAKDSMCYTLLGWAAAYILNSLSLSTVPLETQ